MDKIKFGRIVKSLRLEHVNYETGGKWNQEHLANESNLTRLIVSNIERGKKTKLDGSEIVGLADALQLSTLERQEFFASATEVNEEGVIADLLQPDMAFDHAWNILSSAKLPSFLTDPFFNLIGINRIMMAFHGLSDQMVDAAVQTTLGVNVLNMMFRKTAILRRSMGTRWNDIARANLHQFRYTSLRYRHMEQFETILSHMHTQPDFTRLWMETRINPSNDFFSQLRHYDYNHTIHGPVCYAATLSKVITNYGELYLTTHMPCNDETSAKFTEIGQMCRGARKIMPWPFLS